MAVLPRNRRDKAGWESRVPIRRRAGVLWICGPYRVCADEARRSRVGGEGPGDGGGGVVVPAGLEPEQGDQAGQHVVLGGAAGGAEVAGGDEVAVTPVGGGWWSGEDLYCEPDGDHLGEPALPGGHDRASGVVNLESESAIT